MSKRLIEVANELNVSTKVIVEHLRQNGFDEVNDKPTAKLTPEMCDSLVSHFRNAIAIKEQADQLSNASGQKKKEERNSKDKLRPWERPTLTHKEPKSLLNKEVTTDGKSNPEENTTAPEAEVVEHTTTVPEPETTSTTTQPETTVESKIPTLTGPKILGKVNLDALNTRGSNNSNNNSNNNNRRDQNRDQNRNKFDRRNDDRNDRRGDNQRTSNSSNSYNKNTSNQTPANQEPKKQLHTPKANPKHTEIPKKDKEEELTSIENTTPILNVNIPETDPVLPVDQPEGDNTDNGDNSYRAETPQLQGLKILGKINLDKPKPSNNNNNSNNSNNNNKNQRQRQPFNRDGQRNPNEHRQNDRQDRPRTQNTSNQNTSNTNNNTPNTNQPQSTTPARNVTYIKAPHKQNPPVNNTTPKTEEEENDDKKKSPRKRIKDNNTPTTTPQTTKSATKSFGKSSDNKRKKDVSGDAVKATMAKVQANQKRKKIGTTRAERAEKKEQDRLRAEEHTEEAPIQVTEFISVSELAGLMDVSSTDIITTCMSLGIFVSINQRLDADVIELVASEFGYNVEFISAEEQMDIEEEEEEDAAEDLVPRAPIVTVMGHVDHGKTSLLDYIRKANVASGEAGGITQHIGAYEVAAGGGKGKITFLDTPGHEAFTAMRARGAKVTDIAVIIVAADDSVMPQTKEAISHAQAAGVPIIFAINKVDKEGANPERIKQELASMNLLIEEWGGKYQCQEISAKQGLNVDLLLEKILLEAEMLELKGNPKRKAIGAVLEASLEKGRGYVAKILVQSGTLKIGDPIAAGQYSGKIKAMFNERGKNVKTAGPSSPVLVLGLDGAPQAGEKIKVMVSEREAKELASKRAQLARQQQIRASKRITLDDITRRLKVGNFRELNLIVKADMDGSMEALSDSLIKLATDQVQTRIVHKAVGPVTESDVNLALASDAIIVGFQVRPNSTAKKLAEQEGVQIKTYSIIYDAINEVKAALEGLLQPKQVEKEVGMVEIREVFKITKVGTVAGCFVTEGKVTRNSFIRVIRDGIVVFPTKENAQGELASLKRFKDNAAEVKAGFECGLTIKNFDNINPGDMIEVYEIIEVKQRLDDLKMIS